MKKTRLLALVLVLLMSLLFVVSCKNDKGNESESTDNSAAETVDDERLPLTVEKEDNKGREFKILLPESNPLDLASEDDYGTSVSQALYDADATIGEYLNIDITYTPIPGNWTNRSVFNNRLLAMAMDSVAEFDLIMAENSASYAYALQNGLVQDLKTIDILQLDQPWYLSDMTETYGINGKLFGIRSDASLTTYETLGVIFFNSALITDYQLESPYELVKADQWTAEQMFTMALRVGESGDGLASDLTKDVFGYIGQHVASRGFMTAFNVELVERNSEDNNLYMKTSAGADLIDKWDYLYDIFENNSDQIIVPVSADAKLGSSAFAEGRSLFYNGFFSHASTFRDMTADWGVVPMPKYNEEQTRYYTPAGTQAMMLMIMSNPYSTGLSSKVLELKSYYNYYDVVPVYYEETLGYQYGRSPEHIEMMKLIRETSTLTFLAAMNGNMSPDPWVMFQMDSYIRNGTSSKSSLGGSVSTWYAENIGTWNAYLQTLYRSLK